MENPPQSHIKRPQWKIARGSCFGLLRMVLIEVTQINKSKRSSTLVPPRRSPTFPEGAFARVCMFRIGNGHGCCTRCYFCTSIRTRCILQVAHSVATMGMGSNEGATGRGAGRGDTSSKSFTAGASDHVIILPPIVSYTVVKTR